MLHVMDTGFMMATNLHANLAYAILTSIYITTSNTNGS